MTESGFEYCADFATTRAVLACLCLLGHRALMLLEDLGSADCWYSFSLPPLCSAYRTTAVAHRDVTSSFLLSKYNSTIQESLYRCRVTTDSANRGLGEGGA